MENVSRLMQELRDALDARGVEWSDHSADDGFTSGIVARRVIERTRVGSGENPHSIIYGSMAYSDGEERGITYGWPEMLEYWPEGHVGDPYPATVEEIVEAICGVGE